jgi:hypothetical protein
MSPVLLSGLFQQQCPTLVVHPNVPNICPHFKGLNKERVEGEGALGVERGGGDFGERHIEGE